MGFLIQYTCLKCGFQTPFGDLIEPYNIRELFVCTCNQCNSMFQRELRNGQAINRCIHCGSIDITINENQKPVSCPKCGEPNMKLESVGTYF